MASVTQWRAEVTNSLALPTPSASAGIAPPFPFELAPTPAVALTTISPAPSAGSFLDPLVLPPDDIVRDLIALYFSHIAPWAPILPPQQFNAPWSIVVYAIVVVSLRLSTDPRIAGTKQQLRAAAKSHVLSHAIESTSIASVQALALLALDLIGSEQGPSSWGILALLTRSAVHLGLVTEDEGAGQATRVPNNLSRTSIIPPAHDWREDEARRRLFWLIFSLDRYACASTGWDFALPDFDIRRRLPCSDEIWAGGVSWPRWQDHRTELGALTPQQWHSAPLFKPVLHRDAHPDPSALSPMAYLVEALDLLGRSHSLQSRVIEANDAREVEHRKDMVMTLTSAAKRWFGDLPLSQMTPGPMPLVIAGVYHATLLKLNAYYAYPALSNGSPIEPYGGTCTSSARALVQLVHQARDVGFRQASSPLFIWSAWVAARVLFINAFLAHQAQPDDDFEVILQGLREMAAYWSLASESAGMKAIPCTLADARVLASQTNTSSSSNAQSVNGQQARPTPTQTPTRPSRTRSTSSSTSGARHTRPSGQQTPRRTSPRQTLICRISPRGPCSPSWAICTTGLISPLGCLQISSGIDRHRTSQRYIACRMHDICSTGVWS